MELITSFFRFFLIFFAIRTVLNILFKVKLGKKQKIEADIDTVQSFSKVEEKEKEVAIDMVFDTICETYVPKPKAYQVVEDDRTHYFCSWECRQKYIESI
ncbi:MYM-type Zinc finger with FCS sequence motif-containing protein [Natronincola peptidivorans]|uniref:MYM-type Zinc finger with FCS sequence motif-containing protein n=1 Tax=Natronincola peptidivorans TaxID=426128 RepID=A0A1I0DXX5_9FIRM|nr:hypothetical protein [Natronincola peptidivorans]SET37279.1 MYM-type Zinc finger with FCS sequence motif-containing protein [Natronincola peptidivorans]